MLDAAARAALVELLGHLADACETVGTTVWDRTAALALRVREPHRPLMTDFPARSATGGAGRGEEPAAQPTARPAPGRGDGPG